MMLTDQASWIFFDNSDLINLYLGDGMKEHNGLYLVLWKILLGDGYVEILKNGGAGTARLIGFLVWMRAVLDKTSKNEESMCYVGRLSLCTMKATWNVLLRRGKAGHYNVETADFWEYPEYPFSKEEETRLLKKLVPRINFVYSTLAFHTEGDIGTQVVGDLLDKALNTASG